MKRHFYLSDDLDDLEAVQTELEREGIDLPQIHTLSNNEAGLDTHHLNQVESLLRKDIIHLSLVGFVIGIFVALIPPIVAYFVGVRDPYIWIPVGFLSVILWGFCTWEGGLIGIHRPNKQFERFEQALRNGKHLLIVDIAREEGEALKKVMAQHPRVSNEGVAEPMPNWLGGAQRQWFRFIRWAP